MTAGLLFIYSDPLEGVSANEFNDWYSTHAKDRLQYAGVLSATRFTATDGKTPANLAVYRLKDIEGLESDEYKAIKPTDESKEREMVSKIVFDRRIYKEIKSWGTLDGTPELFQPNCMTPGEKNEADQRDWYDQEHIPLFQDIKGWQQSIRYEIVDRKIIKGGVPSTDYDPATHPKFLMAHWWSKQNDLGGEKRKAAAQTAWTGRVKGYMQFHEGPRMFETTEHFVN